MGWGSDRSPIRGVNLWAATALVYCGVDPCFWTLANWCRLVLYGEVSTYFRVRRAIAWVHSTIHSSSTSFHWISTFSYQDTSIVACSWSPIHPASITSNIELCLLQHRESAATFTDLMWSTWSAIYLDPALSKSALSWSPSRIPFHPSYVLYLYLFLEQNIINESANRKGSSISWPPRHTAQGRFIG